MLRLHWGKIARTARAWAFRRKLADSLPDLEEVLRKHSRDLNKNSFIAGAYIVRIRDGEVSVMACAPSDENQLRLFQNQSPKEVKSE